MALVSVKEKGMLNRSVRNLTEKTATRYYVVTYDAATTTVAAETASGIPLVGDVHPDDSARFVHQVEARAEAESQNKVYEVQVDYSSTRDLNPLSQPAQISWDFDDATTPYFLDKSGTPKPVVNSVGELFENFLERETGSIRCTYKVNATSFSPSTAVTYKDTLNSGSFTIDGVSISTGQAKLKAITAGPVTTVLISGSSVTYREVTYTLQFRASWDDVIDDRGFNEKDGSTGKVKEISKGTPPVKPDKPWPLNGSGAAKPNVTDAPSTITFKPYASLSFSGFGFA